MLRTELEACGSKLDWSHVTDQIGMFAFTGMTPEMVDELTEKYHIYLTRDGRISIAGVTPNNSKYVAAAIHSVTSSPKEDPWFYLLIEVEGVSTREGRENTERQLKSEWLCRPRSLKNIGM